MGKKFITPAGVVHLENRRIARLGRVLGRASYLEWRCWDSVIGKDALYGWMGLALNLIKIKTRTRKLRRQTIFTREVMLNNKNAKIIDEIRVEIRQFLTRKTTEIIQKKVEHKSSGQFLEEAMD